MAPLRLGFCALAGLGLAFRGLRASALVLLLLAFGKASGCCISSAAFSAGLDMGWGILNDLALARVFVVVFAWIAQ